MSNLDKRFFHIVGVLDVIALVHMLSLVPGNQHGNASEVFLVAFQGRFHLLIVVDKTVSVRAM